MSIQQAFARLEVVSRACIESLDKQQAIALKIQAVTLMQSISIQPLTPVSVDIYNRALILDSQLSAALVTIIEGEVDRVVGGNQ